MTAAQNVITCPDCDGGGVVGVDSATFDWDGNLTYNGYEVWCNLCHGTGEVESAVAVEARRSVA